MTRDAFMKELAYLLQDINEEDRQDALQYYRDYFDDAGPEREEAVLRELGSPERVAAIIRANLAGQDADGGEFTDSGYEDRRFSEPEKPLAQRNGPRSGGQGPQAAGDPYAQAENGPYAGDRGAQTGADRPGSAPGRKPPFTSRPLKIILWIILLVLLFPVLLGVGSGLLGILVGIAALLFGLFLLLGILTLAFLATGVFMIPFGVVVLFSQPAGGLMTAGTGLAFLGGGLLLLALSLLFYGRFVPALVRSAVDAADRLIHKRRPNV